MAAGTLIAAGGTEAEALGPELRSALVELAGEARALVLPTAAAFERPEQVALGVATWLGEGGWTPEALMATTHAEANDEGLVARVADHDLVVLSSGSALHLRQVLLRSALLEALGEVLARGGVLLGIGAGAHVLSDPMFDERGGGLTTGAGLCSVVLATSPDGEDHTSTFARCAAMLEPHLDLLAVPAGSAVAIGARGLTALAGKSQRFRGGELVETLGG